VSAAITETIPTRIAPVARLRMIEFGTSSMQRADDEPDASAICDVTPHGGPGTVVIDVRLEAGCAAGRDDRVVVPGRHLVRPQLQRLVAQS
jgi:hypothetical protein